MPSRLLELPASFQEALTWFANNRGKLEKVPTRLASGTLLQGSQGGGIFCPQGQKYALSLKSTIGAQLNSIYADAEPIFHDDGTWTYDYHEVRSRPNAAGKEKNPTWKNLRLLNNFNEGIPVGVFREVRIPGAKAKTHQILGIAQVVAHDERTGFFTLKGVRVFSEKATISIEDLDRDTRKTVTTVKAVREGQSLFRAQLLEAYRGRCAITGYDLPDALEAAHISPYRGRQTNLISNGLLLRADIHGLFDAGVIAIDSSSLDILLSKFAAGSKYAAELSGAKLRIPLQDKHAPDLALIASHREKWAHCFGN